MNNNFFAYKSNYCSPMDVTSGESSAYDKYKEIGDSFCNQYYSTYDSNFEDLSQLYKGNSCFNYLGDEIVGFANIVDKIKNHYKIFKFCHVIKTVDIQPIDRITIIILVSGSVITNMTKTENNFIETIVLKQDITNSFYIHNTIFRII